MQKQCVQVTKALCKLLNAHVCTSKTVLIVSFITGDLVV